MAEPNRVGESEDTPRDLRDAQDGGRIQTEREVSYADTGLMDDDVKNGRVVDEFYGDEPIRQIFHDDPDEDVKYEDNSDVLDPLEKEDATDEYAEFNLLDQHS